MAPALPPDDARPVRTPREAAFRRAEEMLARGARCWRVAKATGLPEDEVIAFHNARVRAALSAAPGEEPLLWERTAAA